MNAEMPLANCCYCHRLDTCHVLYEGRIPNDLQFSEQQFKEAWLLHPFGRIHGKRYATPPWRQAYEKDYDYCGQSDRVLPIPSLLQPLMDWLKSIDPRLNGLFVNWYDGKLGHYFGKHRDITYNLVPDSSIFTVSFGESRKYRLRPQEATRILDFDANDGTMFVMPLSTNQAWTHEIPKSNRYTQRRISITARAFCD
jgi:alkylated DNA repair dioxygenase AlkB